MPLFTHRVCAGSSDVAGSAGRGRRGHPTPRAESAAVGETGILDPGIHPTNPTRSVVREVLPDATGDHGGKALRCLNVDVLTPLSFLQRVPSILGGGEGIPAPALTLTIVLAVMTLALGVESLTLRAIWALLRTARLRRLAVPYGPMTVATLDARGDLAGVVAAVADRADVGFDDIEAALDHEYWLRHLLRRGIVRRGGGRRELDRLRRTPVLFAVRPSSTGVHFRWDGRVGSDEPQPFHEWLSSACGDLDDVRIITRPTDAVVGGVFTDTADDVSSADAHPLTILAGLDDPAVGGAVVPTGPPAAARTTRIRVLPVAA